MDQRTNNHVRIKDIAQRAGCSIGTVDRVLHNRGRVSPEMKQRILEIIEEMGYRPNVSARALASNKPLRIGILLPAFRKGEYWELPNRGIREAVERFEGEGYRIEIVARSFTDPGSFYRSGMNMLREAIRGIITTPATYNETVRLVRSYFQQHIPFILIDSDIEGVPSLSFIGKDPVQTGLTAARVTHQVTRHVAGCKLVWIINLPRNLNQMYALLARECGYMKFFADRKIQREFTLRFFDIEDPGNQKELDRRLEGMLGEATPHAIYVTGSRVHKVARSIERLVKGPRPLLVGHDLIPGNIRALKEESIDFVIEEEAWRQGYLAIESMVRNLILKEEVPAKQFMNLMIYTPENLPAAQAALKAVQ